MVKHNSVVADLSHQTTNITIGQLIAKCSSLCRELRVAISTESKKTMSVAQAYTTNSEKVTCFLCR